MLQLRRVLKTMWGFFYIMERMLMQKMYERNLGLLFFSSFMMWMDFLLRFTVMRKDKMEMIERVWGSWHSLNFPFEQKHVSVSFHFSPWFSITHFIGSMFKMRDRRKTVFFQHYFDVSHPLIYRLYVVIMVCKSLLTFSLPSLLDSIA